MRPAAKIKQWVNKEELGLWLEKASDQWSYKRRKVIWLTAVQRLSAKDVAKQLQVSVPAIRKWVRQYNDYGPVGLERKGRGGRRRYFMTRDDEVELLKPFVHKIVHGGVITRAKDIKIVIEKKLQRKVSLSYVYRLLSRHRWAEIIAQSRGNMLGRGIQNKWGNSGGFYDISSPWHRKG